VFGKEVQVFVHPKQVEVVYSLSNGQIAVSGGPKNFEILLYDANESTGKYEFVNSLSTNGMFV